MTPWCAWPSPSPCVTPIVDGQGNLGSRDGDGAAAIRYTEARMTPIADLLLAEIDEDTVDFRRNYDGTLEEPGDLPARLPFLLLNGASRIAVGMATEIPSHNLREVAEACAMLALQPECSDDALLDKIPGPDYQGGGHIISSQDSIRQAYRSKAGGRWKPWPGGMAHRRPRIAARRLHGAGAFRDRGPFQSPGQGRLQKGKIGYMQNLVKNLWATQCRKGDPRHSQATRIYPESRSPCRGQQSQGVRFVPGDRSARYRGAARGMPPCHTD
ncbi:DNA gyrase subunit A [Acidithiobacillus sulfuriphilus]|uniref:DNA gyrase subunit A n=1 Tax=Acidithiobacillus sulfuriphilus TaxID=1867749 RepID=A0ACD5HR46_9PROT|nr:DNA gyrase subunit A [Acidithiobacillus sulfuriphilus]